MIFSSMDKSLINEAFSCLYLDLEKERRRIKKHIGLNHSGSVLSGKRDYHKEFIINCERAKKATELHQRIKNEVI